MTVALTTWACKLIFKAFRRGKNISNIRSQRKLERSFSYSDFLHKKFCFQLKNSSQDLCVIKKTYTSMMRNPCPYNFFKKFIRINILWPSVNIVTHFAMLISYSTLCIKVSNKFFRCYWLLRAYKI